jgi:hypothetical protein
MPKSQLDSSNLCSQPNLEKRLKFVTFCIVGFKYIKMFPTSDQIFQISYLGDIEMNWIAQSMWGELEKSLFGLENGYILTIFTLQPNDSFLIFFNFYL